VVSAIAVLIYAVYSYYIERTGRMEQAGLPEQAENIMQPSAEATLMRQTEPALDDTLIGKTLTETRQIEVSDVDASEAGAGDFETGEVEVDDVEAGELAETDIESVIETEMQPGQEVGPDISSEAADPVVGEAVDEKIVSVPVVAPITGGDVLTVSAEQESWAEIVDANDIRLFYGMIKPGRDLRLTGQTPFDIFLGNAPVVSLSLNATDIDMTKYIRSNNIAQFKVSVEEGQIRVHQ
jgi:cytoskeletal protein RodZ